MMLRMVALLLTGLLCIPAFSPAVEMSGRQILEEAGRRQKTRTEQELFEMILVDSQGNQEKREVCRYIKEVEPDIYRTLLVFLSPADVRGTALLLIQHRNEEDEQYLYLPALGNLRRIAKGNQRTYFMGTDFAYEDMRTDDLSMHAYYRLPDEIIDGKPCFVVEAVPNTREAKRDSGYSKRIIWVRQDTFFSPKAEFYDKRGKLLKVLQGSDWEQVTSEVWRPQQGTMENVQRRHKTILKSLERKINIDMPNEMFTTHFILKGKHVKQAKTKK
ncbi:MAG: outer membrane lipoprotein-sorting protein [Deltaproteobacteria bacterium]|nr:outer membrane lipoprotein-sorting protein [Deltaproteobacteria bacterium]MBW2071012.1 outer membrane lipoprotein-sorting protein [Deltaproteobacteria bacterium]